MKILVFGDRAVCKTQPHKKWTFKERALTGEFVIPNCQAYFQGLSQANVLKMLLTSQKEVVKQIEMF